MTGEPQSQQRNRPIDPMAQRAARFLAERDARIAAQHRLLNGGPLVGWDCCELRAGTDYDLPEFPVHPFARQAAQSRGRDRER